MKHKFSNPSFSFHLLLRTCLLAILFTIPAQAAEVAARVQFVVGQVNAFSQDGTQRKLNKGDEIFAGDTLESSRASAAQLVFSDNGRMAVRANTTVRVAEYHYDAEDRKNSNSLIALFEGAVRSITGLIGQFNKNNVVVVTPLATIGIRGTDHETIHIPSDFHDGESKDLVGTYNKVYSGGTSLRSVDGLLQLDSNQIGFVAGIPGRTQAPTLIDSLPKAIDELLAWKMPPRTRAVAMRNGMPGNTVNLQSDTPAVIGIAAPASNRELNFSVLNGKASATGIAASAFGMATASGRGGAGQGASGGNIGGFNPAAMPGSPPGLGRPITPPGLGSPMTPPGLGSPMTPPGLGSLNLPANPNKPKPPRP